MIKLRNLLTFCLVALLGLSACKEDEGSNTPSRLFRPISMKYEATEGKVLFTWVCSAENVQGYELSISDNPLFSEGSTIETYETTSNTFELTEGIAITRTTVDDFYIRIKAISNDEQIGDSKPYESTFQPYREQQLNPVTNNLVTNNTITVTWKKEANGDNLAVTKIVCYNGETLVGEYPLDATSIDTRSYTINGLQALTTYRILLFNDDVRRGKTEAKTRGDNDVIVQNDVELIDAVATSPAGSIIRIKGGVYDLLDTDLRVARTMAFEGFGDSTVVLKLKNFLLHEQVGTFSVTDLSFDGTGTKDNLIQLGPPSGDYGTFESVDSILINNCLIRGYKKSLLIYGGTSNSEGKLVKNVTINNSVMSNMSIGNGAHFIDLRYPNVDAIIIKNSTMYNMGRALIRIPGGRSDAKLHLIGNTIYKVGQTSQLFIDMDGHNSNRLPGTVNLILKNNIMVKSNGKLKGYRIPSLPESGGLSTTERTNNNMTDDFDLTSAAGNAAPNGIGWTNESGNIIAVPAFKDAENGDLTLSTSSVQSSSGMGDPRWRESKRDNSAVIEWIKGN